MHARYRRSLGRRLLIGSTLAFVAAAPAAGPTPASQPTSPNLDALYGRLVDATSAEVRDRALAQIRELGPAAAPLVPRLEARLAAAASEGHYDAMERTALALAAIGTPEVVPILIRAERGRAHGEALRGLLAVGEPAADPLASVVLAEPDRPHLDILIKLGEIGGPATLAALDRIAAGPAHKEDVKQATALATAMRDCTAERHATRIKAKVKSDDDRWAIRYGLTSLTTALAMLADEDPAVRRAGAWNTHAALIAFDNAGRGREADRHLVASRAAIARALLDPARDPEVLRRIAARVGVDTAAAAEAMVFAAPDDKRRLEAIGLLIKDRGAAAVPTIEKVLAATRDELQRREIAKLLLRIPPVDERIDAALRDGGRTLREMARQARMGQGAEGARKMLALAATLDGARRRRAVPDHPEGYAVALAALDGDDARLFAPAAHVVASRYSPDATRQPVPSPRAVERLVALLDARDDADAREAATRALTRMPTLSSDALLARLKSDDVGTRRAAATMLAGNPNSHGEFVAIPAAALAPLVAAAGDADAVVRDRIASAIGRFVDTRTSAWAGWTIDVRDAALAQLESMLNDADRDVRATALRFFTRGDGWLDRLRAARRHPNASVAYLATWIEETRSKPTLGPGTWRVAPRAVPDLVAVLADPAQGYWAREWAAVDLGRHGGAAAAAVGPLATELASSPAPRTRFAAAAALGKVGHGSPAAATALVAAFDDADFEVALEAVRAIGGVGPVAAAAALPRLEAFLAAEGDGFEPQDHFRVAAFDALGGLGEAAVPLLASRIEPGNRDAMQASEALRRLGPAAAPALPAIVARLGRAVDAPAPPSFGDEVLVETLDKIGPAAARDGTPVLARILRSDALRRLHSEAFAALTSMGPGAATPEVIDAMLNVKGEHAGGTESLRRDANIALAAMGEAAAPAVPALVAQVRAEVDRKLANLALPDEERRRVGPYDLFNSSTGALEAVRALGRIGPRAAEALPVLREALPLMSTDPHWHPTNVLKQAIARLEGAEPPTSPDVQGRDDRPRGPSEGRWDDDPRPPDFGGPFGPQNR